MHRYLLTLALIAALLTVTACSSSKKTQSKWVDAATMEFDRAASYGETIPDDATATPLSADEVIAAPEKWQNESVTLVGTVTDVCPKRGCWLRMNDGEAGDDIFVKFTCPVDGRLIPADALGKPVMVYGTFTITEISEATARHYKEDAGASEEEISRIMGPQKMLYMQSPAARVAGIAAEPR